jgi:hypothetical protein
MKKRWLWWGILLLMAVVAWKSLARPLGAPLRARLVLGDRALYTLARATRVEAFRLKPQPFVKATWKKPNIGGHPVVANGNEQDRSFAARLAPLLLNNNLYDPRRVHTGFQPGVAFRIWCDDEKVDVVICFTCNNLKIMGDKGWAPLQRPYGHLGGFDPVRPALLRLAKEAFPNDKQIQALKEKL